MDDQRTKEWTGLEDYVSLLMGKTEREFNQIDPEIKIWLVRFHAMQINFEFDENGRLFVDRGYVGDKEDDKKVNYYHAKGLINLDEAYRLAVVVTLIQEGIARKDPFVFDVAKGMGYDLIGCQTIEKNFNSSFIDNAKEGYHRITSPTKSESREKH